MKSNISILFLYVTYVVITCDDIPPSTVNYMDSDYNKLNVYEHNDTVTYSCTLDTMLLDGSITHNASCLFGQWADVPPGCLGECTIAYLF